MNNTTTNYAILSNMYYQGSVGHDNMATLRTKNYIIDIIREEVTKEFLQIQYRYRCSLIFKDLTGREILRLTFNESQSQALLDNMNTFIFEDYQDMMCLSNIFGQSMLETYSIYLSNKTADINTGEYFCEFKVVCYNSATGTFQPILSTILSDNELDELINIMFFIFLIDLASEREGIYKV